MENRIIEHKDMRFDPEKHHRRSIRLRGYDYSQSGSYFITICTHNRECLFGDVVDGKMILNEFGNVAQQCWLEIPQHFEHVELDAFVVMPNHVHGIIIINNNNDVEKIAAKNELMKNDANIGEAKNYKNVGAKNFSPLHENRFCSPSRTIGSIVRGFKIGVTKWFRQNTDIYTVWQRNYYEHIVRDEMDLQRIRQYIMDNPKNWGMDENYRRDNL